MSEKKTTKVKKKHAGGRPTKYRPEMNAKVDEYLKECVDSYEEFHKTRGQKSDTYERVQTVKLPTIVGFAIYIDVRENTLYDWADKHPQFSKSLEKIKELQHQRLLEKGVSGEYNSTIAKLILSSNHGYAEKKDVTSGGKPIPILGTLMEDKDEV